MFAHVAVVQSAVTLHGGGTCPKPAHPIARQRHPVPFSSTQWSHAPSFPVPTQLELLRHGASETLQLPTELTALPSSCTAVLPGSSAHSANVQNVIVISPWLNEIQVA